MKYTTLKDQAATIKKHLGITIIVSGNGTFDLPAGADAWFLIPSPEKISSSYVGALKTVLAALKKEHGSKFYNWREGQIDEAHIKRRGKYQTPELADCQLGFSRRNISVRDARANVAKDETLLGAYEVGIIALTNPQLVDGSWWGIDCAADDFADGEFSRSPYFDFGDDRLEFDARDVDDASGGYGTASAFLTPSSTSAKIDVCPTKSSAPESTTSIVELKPGVKIQIRTLTEITVLEG